jgi:hypoxanthine phosphoribosyltransferase
MEERITIKDKEFKLYIGQEEIGEAVRRMSAEMNRDLVNENPVFLVVLNGSFIFAADLLRQMTMPCEVSFIKVASYSGTTSAGNTSELIGITEDLCGRTVVIVEDIVDSGVTIEKLAALLHNKKVKQIKVATALYKPGAYRKSMKVDYFALSIGNDFVVGYGMDYNGYGRNLKDIHVLA